VALVAASLTASLTRVFSSPSEQGGVKAQEIALAYQTYALTAMAGVLLPVFVGVEGQAMASRLIPVMQRSTNSPSDFANALADGVEAFWLLPPVPFSGGPAAGVVTGFPGKQVLVGALVGALSSPSSDGASVASRVATALDAGTRTVIVTFAPPPGSTVTLV